MHLSSELKLQVRGLCSGQTAPDFTFIRWPSKKLLTMYIWVTLLSTWTIIDGANIDKVKTTVLPAIDIVQHQLNQPLTRLIDSLRSDNKTDKSVPLQLSLTSTASTSVTSTIINDTNQASINRSTVDGINDAIATISSLPAQIISRNVDSNQFAQKQENVTSTTSSEVVPAHQDDIHKTFLLMCSAHWIRFWSLSCNVHSTSDLFSNTRSSSIRHGISSIAIWRPFDQLESLVELVWFDVAEKQFHRAVIQRQHTSQCDNLLGIEFNQTLDYGSNPFTNQSDTFLNEKLVKLAIDNRNQLLFAANYVQNRVDVYRLDSATASNNEMVWLASFHAHHPIDIALDENERNVFWVESRKRICHLEYRFEEGSFLQMNRNLSRLIHCTAELSTAPPQAITLDKLNKKIIWGSEKGKLYRDSYHLANLNQTELIGQTTDEIVIRNLAMNGNILYLSDEHLTVQSFHMDKNQFKIVSIEPNTLFGLLLVDNLTVTSIVEYSDEPVTSSTWITTTTSAHSSEGGVLSSALPSAQPNKTESIILPVSNRATLTTILLLTIVPLILIFVIVCAIFVSFQKNRTRPNSCTSGLFFLPSRFTHYSQLRKNRANSTGRDILINPEEVEQQPHTNEAALFDSNGTLADSGPRPPARGQCHGQQYRQNLVRQSSGIDDIEDMFGSGMVHHHQRAPQTCIACRDQDICQDKGICMATYRVL